MMSPADFPADLFFILVMAGGGVMVGLLAGLFGIGGGTFIVPMMYEVLRHSNVPEHWRMQVCIGTSLAVIIPVSIASFHSHNKRGYPDVRLLKRWALPLIAGVMIGAIFATIVKSIVLKYIFIAVCTLTALRFLLHEDRRWKFGLDMPEGPQLYGQGLVIGILSSLMGMGGGIFSALLMALYNRPIHQAVATSAGVGVLVSIPGALVYALTGWTITQGFPLWPLGFVLVLPVLLIAPISALFTPLGVKLAHMFSRRKLEIAFAIYLLLIAGRFSWTLLHS